MVGQPLDELEDHAGRQLDQAELLLFLRRPLLALAVQADHHRQRQRLAAPGGGGAKGEDDHVEATGRHFVGDRRRGDRVVEVAGAVHLAPALVDQAVVQQQGEQALRRPALDKVDDQASPELVRRPLALADPACVGAVAPSVLGRDDAPEPGQGAAAGAERPGGDELLEEKLAGSGEAAGEQTQERDPGRGCRHVGRSPLAAASVEERCCRARTPCGTIGRPSCGGVWLASSTPCHTRASSCSDAWPSRRRSGLLPQPAVKKSQSRLPVPPDELVRAVRGAVGTTPHTLEDRRASSNWGAAGLSTQDIVLTFLLNYSSDVAA